MLSSGPESSGVWQRSLPSLSACGQLLDTSPDTFGQLREFTGELNVRQQMMDGFAADGYLYLRDFFDRDSVQEARASLLEQLDDHGFLLPGSNRSEGLANPAQPTGRAFGNPLNQHDRAVRELVFGPRAMRFYDHLFAEPATHFNYVWFRTKGPGIGSSMHCDIVYMGRGTPNLVFAWTPLGDIPLEMGGLIVLEHSRRKSDVLRNYLDRDVDEYCSNHDDADLYASGEKWWDGTVSLRPADLREELGGRWLTAEYAMGDLVLFGQTTVHGSLDNQSDRIRLSVDTRYQRASEPIDERWVGENPVGHGAAMKRGRVC